MWNIICFMFVKDVLSPQGIYILICIYVYYIESYAKFRINYVCCTDMYVSTVILFAVKNRRPL